MNKREGHPANLPIIIRLSIIAVLSAVLWILASAGSGSGNESAVAHASEPNASPDATPAATAPAATAPATITPPATTKQPATPVKTAESRVRICLAGDILLHEGPDGAAKTGNSTYNFKPFFKDIKPYINGDINIVNVDGNIDSYGGNKNIAAYPLFNYPREIAGAIKYAGFDTVITANNHAFDNRWAGLVATRKNISNAGLKPLGTYTSQVNYDKPYIREVNGIKVGIVAWSALDNGMSPVMGDHLAYAMRKFNQSNTNDVPRMLDDVKKLRKAGADVVIMYLHWGAEYQDAPSAMQRQIAEKLMKGGVDIIAGDHSHCVQPAEFYQVKRGGKTATALCIYSLGNFFADQRGLDPPQPKTSYGMLVNVTVTRDSKGNISISQSSYIPTVCARDALRATHKSSYSYGYTVLPAGKYAALTKAPTNISSSTISMAKSSWSHVCSIVGKEIKARRG